MKISALTFLAFQLNGAVDSGKLRHISFHDVGKEIEAGTIFDFLVGNTEHLDISILTAEDKQELVYEWASLRNAVDARRKFCVEQSGICLLIAYLLEGIQTRARGAGA